ncbi:ParA family protein [Chitinasiproducens palmae]|uniref:Chromosome partitioning protein n=1 Tax=Chitinasiproducens palmae TaxID=1770053 RepID=A0A1H2PPW5_9BURK|nr:ParA family protein [Chitinasiproducens palmae]SDV48003.1 chromosome partitioning protein [Chitinasiproducens palmae]
MTIIVVANPKGGVGKSTLSTQIAGYLASTGESVALGDLDPQQSTAAWLSIRPEALPAIEKWSLNGGEPSRPGTRYGVLDTPAGLRDDGLRTALSLADKVIVPVQPSIFDIYAIKAFLDILLEKKRIKRGKIELALVGMRADQRMRSTGELQRFIGDQDVPVITYLRDTQNYVQLAAHGHSLWDVAPSRVERDLEQWAPLTGWLQR